MSNKYINKFNEFLKKRITILFIMFFVVCVIANLPSLNYLTDIFSHFKLQYIYCALLFFVFFIYLSFFYKKYIFYLFFTLVLVAINSVDVLSNIQNSEYSFALNKNIKIGLFNVLTKNSNYNLVLDEIYKEKPNVVVLQEVDDEWLENIASLKELYPYFVEHSRDDNFGISLYSNIPIVSSQVEQWSNYQIPVINAKLKDKDEEISFIAVHTLPPVGVEYFNIRNEMFENIASRFNKNNKTIILGDFNTTIYSPYYKKYFKNEKILDAGVITGNLYEGTWNAFWASPFRITLEHVLSTKNIKPVMYKNGRFVGSDHYPVFVDFSY